MRTCPLNRVESRGRLWVAIEETTRRPAEVAGRRVQMVRLFLCATLIACSLLSGNQAMAVDATWPWSFGGVDYGVQTAPHVTVKQVKGPDFDIYKFSANGRIFLSAYVGNNPDFPGVSPIRILSKNHDPVAGIPANTIIYQAPAGTRSRETLVTLKQVPGKYQFIHFFYSNDSGPDAAAADKIIVSLEYFGIERPADVTISAFLCNESTGETPPVAITRIDGRTTTNQSPSWIDDKILTYAIDVDPGLYVMDIQTKKGCAWDALISVLQGHKRNIPAYVSSRPLPGNHTNCGLAGTLPFKGLTVSLSAPKGTMIQDLTTSFALSNDEEIQAVVEDQAYYFERIWPIQYKLIIGLGDSRYTLPVDLTVLSKGTGACSGTLQKDISSQSILRGLSSSNSH